VFDQPSRLLLECPGGHGRWGFDKGSRCSARPFVLGFVPLPPADVAVPAVVSDDVLARIRDMGGGRPGEAENKAGAAARQRYRFNSATSSPRGAGAFSCVRP
jgi:hypothetical protein